MNKIDVIYVVREAIKMRDIPTQAAILREAIMLGDGAVFLDSHVHRAVKVALAFVALVDPACGENAAIQKRAQFVMANFSYAYLLSAERQERKSH